MSMEERARHVRCSQRRSVDAAATDLHVDESRNSQVRTCIQSGYVHFHSHTSVPVLREAIDVEASVWTVPHREQRRTVLFQKIRDLLAVYLTY